MARKKITQVTSKDIEGIINNSVQSAKNRLVGNAAEQKKMFVRPIANTDGSPSVAKLVQRLAQETEDAMQQLENNVEDLEDSLVAPPPADSVPLSGVFFTYDRETETLDIVGEKGVGEEDVRDIVETETNEQFSTLEGNVETLSKDKQDNLSFADAYNAENNKVATEATVAKEVAKIIGGADAGYDTLKEIADWIIAHPNSVSEINAKIIKNAEEITKNAEAIRISNIEIIKNANAIADQKEQLNVSVSDIKELSETKQSKLEFADEYNASTNKVATEATVKAAAVSAVAEVVASASDEFDTLKEMETWLKNHEGSAAAMNTKIAENTTSIKTLESQMADLLYMVISIASFTHNKDLIEYGETVTAVTLSWKTNKPPKELTLDGAVLDANDTAITITDLSITFDDNKTWTLVATDERSAIAKKTTSIAFYNGVYYGVAELPTEYNSDFIRGLVKELSGTRARTFSTTAGTGQYIYYCLPTRLGICSFVDADTGLGAAFELAAKIDFTNAKNYTEKYYVYQSVNANLGSVKITVS